jgi:CubicO group peptidase (beta-lactamase class C family)
VIAVPRTLVALGVLAFATGCAESPAAEETGSVAVVTPRRPVRPRATLDSARLAEAYDRAAQMPRVRSLLVEWRGERVGERYWRGATATTHANVKSVSKSIVSALVGIAIAEGHLEGLHQTIGELLPRETRMLDSAKRAITLEDLITMRAGLASTSFGDYGAFVSSRHWVQYVLTRPMEAEPGGRMLYSTGSSHLLSAILTRATGTSTHRFAARELARPLGFQLRPWTTDPQGIYFGGNEMRLTPRQMLAFGRLYLRGGRAPDGTQVLPREWIDSSWVRRTSSPWNGHGYGYGWWMRETRGVPVYFAWGYGGQFIFVVPALELVAVITSDPNTARDGGHLGALHELFDELIVGAVAEAGS